MPTCKRGCGRVATPGSDVCSSAARCKALAAKRAEPPDEELSRKISGLAPPTSAGATVEEIEKAVRSIKGRMPVVEWDALGRPTTRVRADGTIESFGSSVRAGAGGSGLPGGFVGPGGPPATPDAGAVKRQPASMRVRSMIFDQLEGVRAHLSEEARDDIIRALFKLDLTQAQAGAIERELSALKRRLLGEGRGLAGATPLVEVEDELTSWEGGSYEGTSVVATRSSVSYTSGRSLPTSPNVGDIHVDTGVGLTVIFDGTRWVELMTPSSPPHFESFDA